MKAEIRLTVNAPTDCTEDEFMEWLKWELGQSASIKIINPLCEYEFSYDNCKNVDITILV